MAPPVVQSSKKPIGGWWVFHFAVRVARYLIFHITDCVLTDNDFYQQRLKAWQPILTPKWVVVTFLTIGIPFVIIGFLLKNASDAVSGELDAGAVLVFLHVPPFSSDHR